MELNSLTAISPIDGRYRNTTKELAAYFSEFALIKYRVFIEIEYFIALCEHPLKQLRNFDADVTDKLRAIFQNFSEQDATAYKRHRKNNQP
jgi:adenylosuccinate lyase